VKGLRSLGVIAGIYAVCGLILGLILQTKFLSDDAYLAEGPGRLNAVQVRGEVVFVSDWEYYAFKAALYPSVIIIIVLVFGTTILRSRARK
jgi:hypothetical protein